MPWRNIFRSRIRKQGLILWGRHKGIIKKKNREDSGSVRHCLFPPVWLQLCIACACGRCSSGAKVRSYDWFLTVEFYFSPHPPKGMKRCALVTCFSSLQFHLFWGPEWGNHERKINPGKSTAPCSLPAALGTGFQNLVRSSNAVRKTPADFNISPRCTSGKNMYSSRNTKAVLKPC